MYRPQREERVNALTHTLGIVLSLVAAGFLLPAVFRVAEPWLVTSCVLYLFSLLGVYCSSTMSHVCTDDRRRQYRILDQAFIYLLIVASYTPFSVVYLKETIWWVLLAVMWTLALIGFFSKIIFAHKVQSVAIWLYIALGWIPALFGVPFHPAFPMDCFVLFLLGGVFYTGGTVFLFNDKRVWYFHAIWHLMVVAGSVTHFIAIYISVLRATAIV